MIVNSLPEETLPIVEEEEDEPDELPAKAEEVTPEGAEVVASPEEAFVAVDEAKESVTASP